MSIYEQMPIDSLIECYKNFAAMQPVQTYHEITDELFKRQNQDFRQEAEREKYFVGESGTVYYIELPYDELCIGWYKAWTKHHDYSYAYTKPNGTTVYACLSLCKYDRQFIIEKLENAIEENERELMQS